MTDAVISAVAERVLSILEEQIRYEVNLIRGVEKEELRDLSDKLQTIRNVLDDAEKRGVKEQSVKKWLKKLEDVAYEMDDILDEWNYALLKHEREKVCCSFISSTCLYFKKVVDLRKTAKKIENVKTVLDRIFKERDDFKFEVTQPTTEPPRVQSTSSIELGKIHGLNIEKNKNDIVEKLMIGNGDSEILSIVGMGGLGKTTLAQIVFNDSRVKDCFELRIWICVSDPFDVDGIARGIVESATKEIIPEATNQLELVLQKLRDSISRKKFFLVLDDVWTEEYDKWEPLKVNLNDGAAGSKILVTTRNIRVAKMMGSLDHQICHPKHLSDEECWSLLQRISLHGRSEEECGEFEDVGKKIAEKCKGLPLAAHVLGSLLQFKKSLEEWENVWKSEIWQLEKAEVDLFPHLLLSYNELSPALKLCFSYCAVYPKDSRINVERLIEEWMALGYLGSIIGDSGVEVKGRDYFNNLAMRSLFQQFTRGRDMLTESCKMHDIVHDFALFLRKNDDKAQAAQKARTSCKVCHPFMVSQLRAREYRSLCREEWPIYICDCLTSLRVFRCLQLPLGVPQGMEKLIHLRRLELRKTKLSKEDVRVICMLYFLQTLSLSNCALEEIPSKIGNLVHLRHLDLSENFELKELPKSICSLIELQILNIEGCYCLIGLPEGIHMLENLRHLLIENTTNIRHDFPRGLAQLSDLRTLSEFSRGSGQSKLGLLKNLNRLTGSLRLEIYFSSSRSDLEELAEDAREAELRNKSHIQLLYIRFIEKGNKEEQPSSSLWMDVIEALEPYHKLKVLNIRGYGGSRLPHWISSPLNLMKGISLKYISEVSSLQPMGKLPLLEVLSISHWMKLKVVGREFLGLESSSFSSSSTNDVVAFPKLKKLLFDDCTTWEEWEDITAEEEESNLVSIMPCLEELHVRSCKGLKKLPHRLLRKTSSSLQVLRIGKSSELRNQYGDNYGLSWRSISKNNPQLQLRQS